MTVSHWKGKGFRDSLLSRLVECSCLAPVGSECAVLCPNLTCNRFCELWDTLN